MKEILELYLLFFKIGGVTFGGGYAMLPILQRELVSKRGWATDEELMDYYAIGQCTPGIIAVNVATFIGNKVRGTVGGIVATVGVVSAPICIISVIAMFLSNFAEYAIVKNAFAGIRVCVVVLIVEAIMKLWKKSIVNAIALGIFAVIFILMQFTGISPAILVILGAIAGIVYKQVEGGKK